MTNKILKSALLTVKKGSTDNIILRKCCLKLHLLSFSMYISFYLRLICDA